MTKEWRQKLKYLENEKNFWGEIKSIFQQFQRAFSCQKLSQTWECVFNIVCPYEIWEFIWYWIYLNWFDAFSLRMLNCGLWKVTLLYFYQVWCWEKVDNLQKFRSRRNKVFVGILIFLVFSELGIQYLWQGEISVCKVLVPIKVVPVKNDYFLHPKIELHRYREMNGFLYWHSFC